MKRALFAVTMGSIFSAGAFAQVGVEGRISTRSDVRMSIEGVPGTGGAKLEALAKTLGKPLGDVKQCYGEVVKEHPEVVGTLVVQLELPAGKGVNVQTPDASKALKQMDRCVDRAFGKLDVKDVPRPAGARITLELTNSSASAVDEVREREQEASKIDMEQLPDGALASQGKSIHGEVSYRVTSRDGEAVVARVHQGVRDALPSLFDCRRRAGKKGSPEGEVLVKVALRPQDKPDVSVASCTIPGERTPFCVDAALSQALAKAGKGRAEVRLEFAP